MTGSTPEAPEPDLSIEAGWLLQARQFASPNFDARPANLPIDLIVIHCISLPPGQFGGDNIDRFFANRLPAGEHRYFHQLDGLAVSAHVLLRRDGEFVQYVNFDQRAWHAGVSSHAGRSRCNDFSIGIELEGAEDQPFERVQYHQLVALVRALQDYYPAIGRQHGRAAIVGHEDIAAGRKTDPGPLFSWQLFESILNRTRRV